MEKGKLMLRKRVKEIDNSKLSRKILTDRTNNLRRNIRGRGVEPVAPVAPVKPAPKVTKVKSKTSKSKK